ncbi:peptidase S41 [Gelidibacter salicanalis]|uniref:Peptidase S41 n=1 Tax=Gelidibacter salicanalis TaxID=291193 RepID=A0A5C7AJW3_9FLAO|nr:S41 family peptidase [Gelidibacter salicanalis]TXE07813.1 peptidase S41 [Gelidibacter salicanalis]
MKKNLLLLCSLLLLSSSFAQQDQRTINLQAFAKAYGYVKYFHPSDEASEIDWNNFAAFGASEMLKAENSVEAITTLNALFKPMAPSIVFSNSKQNYDNSILIPPNTKDYELTYWQHKGVSKDMINQGGIYSSVRVNRYKEAVQTNGFGSLATGINPEAYRGKKIKYTAWVKLKDGSQGTGHLWLRVDKPNKKMGFFDNMGNRPIKSNTWEQYEIIGEVDALASGLFLGSFLIGKGSLYVDDVHLYYENEGEWIEIPIVNNNFEAETIGSKNDTTPWTGASKGYAYALETTDVKEGRQSVRISYNSDSKKLKEEPLFDAAPKFGELIEKEIGPGMFCQIPLTLYTTKEHTYPKSKTFTKFKSRLNKWDTNSEIQALYLGNVINTYNVFQHFYPYFAEVNVNWDLDLAKALKRSLTDQTEQEHLITLEKFTAPLKDGHIYVTGGNAENYVPPIQWEWIENALVITKIKAADLGIKVGDIVTKIDGQTSEAYFKEINSTISAGTEGWLNYRAQQVSLFGKRNESLALEIDGKKVVLQRDKKFEYGQHNISIQENNYKILDDNIYYLNLNTIEMDTITALMPQLEKAKGIICDLRGYPNGNHDFISHLLKTNDTSKAWMRVPKIIYPDHQKVSDYENHGWEMPARKPYLGAKKVVFIIDGRAISYAESFMGFIKHYQLATIVGQPTAGTNGNINPFRLLGNYVISWTGMKVVNHDGSQHHAIGIVPDIYVNTSIEGVRAGTDEFLESAIKVISN